MTFQNVYAKGYVLWNSPYLSSKLGSKWEVAPG